VEVVFRFRLDASTNRNYNSSYAMSTTERSMRADARRNRETILAAAEKLFARNGTEVQMDELAEQAGVGMGTLYRHFATKQVLLAAIVGRRFAAMTELARAAERFPEPGASFEALLHSYLEAADGDAAFRYAILGPEKPDWDAIAEQKTGFAEIAERVIKRAVGAGVVRSDLNFEDFVLITRGVLANMNPGQDWRRHMTVTLEGVRTPSA
jgi:AcrR family transcriptional regulator